MTPRMEILVRLYQQVRQQCLSSCLLCPCPPGSPPRCSDSSSPSRLLSSAPTLSHSSWPGRGAWRLATSVSLLLTCLHVALYLLHLALVVGVMAMLILTQHRVADSDTTNEKVLYQQRYWSGITAKAKLGSFGCKQG
ncbi:Myc proto-oncoprotein [Dissostichus eleginoides]|uniref:Myc proto-oncoprotein n=1 Tax=Dissostichus eleginoides TaxID=100907 RepID=A0AAD9F639_DISEL|nr:Myc proto-oncoprotein [Dissostichus eleginoides]